MQYVPKSARVLTHIRPDSSQVLSALVDHLAHRRACSSSTMDPDVMWTTSGPLGIVTLNRPKALNSLNYSMITRLLEIYTTWGEASPVKCIILRGAGEKAFCAGGDVKSVVLEGMSGNSASGSMFFRAEYRTDFAISQLQKPHISLLDGITMGGGAGLSMHGSFRVATEKTLFAMPECGIGLFPDVGASHFLQKLPGALGTYLALTGARLKGVEVRQAGLATHYILSKHIPDLIQKLQELDDRASDFNVVNQVLCDMESKNVELVDPASSLDLTAILPVINACFAEKDTVEKVAAALATNSSNPQFCQDALQQLLKGSPLSAKVTLELLQRTRSLGLAACLALDYRLAVRFTRGEGDFYEGVRATLIDKGSTPKWKYKTLADVPQDAVDRFFGPLEPSEGIFELPDLPHTHGGNNHVGDVSKL